MAESFKSTVKRECWKEHTCVGCESTFRYRLKREETRQGTTPAAAQMAAEQAAAEAVAKGVEMHPCPSCGLYQPDMVADRQVVSHILILVALVLGVVGLLVLYATDLLGRQAVTCAAAGAAALALVGHLRMALVDPNRDLEANRRTAEQAIAAGSLVSEAPGRPGQSSVDPGGQRSGAGLAFVMLLLAAGAAALAAPELLRLVSGWRSNPDCDPAVAGPGDSVDIYLPGQISSLRGLWDGTASVEVLNAKELGLANATLPARTQHASWGKAMFGRRLRTQKNRPWVTAEIPDAESLAGKTARLQVNLEARYPEKEGLLSFHDANQAFASTVDFKLSAPFAGNLYLMIWWLGTALGVAMTLAGGWLMTTVAGRRRRTALPTRLVLLDPNEVILTPVVGFHPETPDNEVILTPVVGFQPETLEEVGFKTAPAQRPAEAAPDYASFLSRGTALLIDWVVLTVVQIIVSFVVNFMLASFAAAVNDPNLTARYVGPIGLVLSLFVPLVYFVGLEAGRSQATLGKAVVGVKVTSVRGQRISIARALVRNLGKILSALPVLLGFLVAILTPKKQALHDLLAGTLVVKRARSGRAESAVEP